MSGTRLGRMPTRAMPLEAPLRKSISSSARCSPVSRSAACGSSDWPNSVSSIPVECRRKSCTPSCCSSLRSVRLTAGCVSDKAVAAAPTLPRRATFKNALSPRWSTAMHNCYGFEAKKQWRRSRARGRSYLASGGQKNAGSFRRNRRRPFDANCLRERPSDRRTRQGIQGLRHRRWRQDRRGRAAAIRLHWAKSVVRKDLTSKSILPGLIDCHVHLRSDGLADPRAQQAGDTDAVALDAVRAQRPPRPGMRRHHDPRLRLSRRHRFRLADGIAAGPVPDAAPRAQRADHLHDRRARLATRSRGRRTRRGAPCGANADQARRRQREADRQWRHPQSRQRDRRAAIHH